MRSLNGNFHKLEDLLNVIEHKPSVIGISETWLTEKIHLLNSIKGYDFLQNNSNLRSGGCALFIKSDLNYEEIRDYNLNEINTNELWIRIKFSKNQMLILGSLYRHPKNYFKDFEECLVLTLNKLNQNKIKYIIGGDININLLENSTAVKDFINNTKSCGCNQLINEHTRISYNQTPSLLDHVYTNICEREITSKILPYDVSDHLPIFTTFQNIFINRKDKSTYLKRNFHNFIEEHYLSDIDLLNLKQEQYPCLSANDSFDIFLTKFEIISDIHAPLELKTRKQATFINQPWTNKTLSALRRKKDILFKKWLKDRTNSRVSDNYKKVRNTYSKTTKKAKQTYINNVLQKSAGNPKLLWRDINNVINFKRNRNCQINYIQNLQGDTVRDPKSVSNEFNEFFVTIGEKLATSIPNIQSGTPLIKPKSTSFFIKPVTPSEIIKLINDLNIDKTVPSTSGPIKLLKLAAPKIAKHLCSLFNRCISEGVFPDCLKIAEVIPLFKTGSKSFVWNFRPISILPPLSKVFEKCLHSRLFEFLEFHKVLDINQFGFKAKCSTENAVLKLCDELSSNFNTKSITCTVFLDLRKAFDTINHKILLQKLSFYGIRGVALKLFESYLESRSQYCIVNCTKSTKKLITCGVPQGSVLGPLLFLVYVNDINLVSNFKINLFADDSCLSLSNKSAVNLEKNVNNELNKIDLWLKTNKLSLNIEKTSYIIFTNRKLQHNFKITIGSATIKRQSQTKYLGIILDEHLTWTPHIQMLQKKMASAVWALSRLRNVASTKTLRTVYFGLVHSKLQYCISCWGASPPSKLLKVKSLQKRALRVICKAPYLTHSEPLFKRQNILKFDDLYVLQVAVIVSKSIHGTWQGSFRPKPVTSVHQYETRYAKSGNFCIPKAYNEVFKRSIGYCGPSIWSKVPAGLKHLDTNAFKSQYKKVLLDQYDV